MSTISGYMTILSRRYSDKGLIIGRLYIFYVQVQGCRLHMVSIKHILSRNWFEFFTGYSSTKKAKGRICVDEITIMSMSNNIFVQ